MRIFDCFPFHNELDLTELRIQELWDTVDYFVIAEASTTHQSNNKPYYLRDNWERFRPYKDKIRYIMVDDMPRSSNTWVNENFQRRSLSRGLTDLQPDDIVIVSDCDEIPRPDVIKGIKYDTEVNNYNRYVLFVPVHYFRFNYMMIDPGRMSGLIIVTRGRAFTDPHSEREITFPWNPKPEDMVFINHGGWHFSYLGQTDFAISKIKGFAHAETNTPSTLATIDVQKSITEKYGLTPGSETFCYTMLNNYYPQTILKNQEKYKDLIITNGNINVYDIFPDIMLNVSDMPRLVDGSMWKK